MGIFERLSRFLPKLDVEEEEKETNEFPTMFHHVVSNDEAALIKMTNLSR